MSIGCVAGAQACPERRDTAGGAHDPDGTVYSLALSGQTLYVGGTFTSVGGEHRENLAAVEVGSGRATAWNPGAGNLVRALLVVRDKVYVGGVFPSVGGRPRRNL